MDTTLFKSMMVTVAFLIIAVFLMLRLKIVSDFIYHNNKKLSSKLIFAVVCGLIGIISTYTGTPVNGAIANARAISIVAGGLLGGPFVGITAGIIAGVHRYAIDINGITAAACALSTLAQGFVGGFMHSFYLRSRYKSVVAFSAAFIGEILQMLLILLLSRPFTAAVELVKQIFLPMVLINSFGVMALMWVFEYVTVERDILAARRTKQALVIAQQCLPYFKKGMLNLQNLQLAADTIVAYSGIPGAAITDTQRVLAASGVTLSSGVPLPAAIQQAVTQKTGSSFAPQQSFASLPSSFYTLSAPLTIQDEVVGALLLFVAQNGRHSETDLSFTSGLASLFSTQLELGQIDYQKRMLQKAEFSVLQSQINPHFFFNSLNTIAAFCREKPEQARELLLALSDYFRRTLNTGEYMIPLQEELQFVEAYLLLEKARFEDKLQVSIHISPSLQCTVPRLILQPIVENAVKHGIKNKTGRVEISITAAAGQSCTVITVQDNGPGIPISVLEGLQNNTLPVNQSIGLANVHNRLISIYGKSNGLTIQTSPQAGTSICITIPQTGGTHPHEDSHC